MIKKLNPRNREQLRRFIVGFAVTATLHLVSKTLTALLTSDNVSNVIDGFLSSYPQLAGWLTTALSSGVIAARTTKGDD